MSFRTVLIVALALTFGGSAAVGINTLRKQAAPAPGSETISVVVAAADIQRGSTITEELVKVREYAKDLVPQGVITTVADAKDRAVLHSLQKGDVIVDEKLAAKEEGHGIAPLIPQGMRAFTIQTPTVSAGLAGFVRPGNHVDVLLTVGQVVNDPVWGGSSTTLLQNVEVLAVDQRVDPNDNKIDPKELRSATLLVTPSQAAKLSLGQTKGTLLLTLRNPKDREPANAKPVTLAELRFSQEKPWEEKAKGLIEAFTKSLKELQKQPAKPTGAPDKQSGYTPVVQIRTLRGTQEGIVVVQPGSR